MELKIDNLELSEQATIQIVDGVLKNIESLVTKHLNQFNAKEYLTIGETASYLSISRGSLGKLIKDGLPVIKIGNIQKIKKSDLEKYLDQYKNWMLVGGIRILLIKERIYIYYDLWRTGQNNSKKFR